MAHYRMLDREPSAIITVSGSEKKIYQDGQIFINDGDNFEIRFFNPLNEKIGISIIFNGIQKNEGLLVLRPGEDITLDRFLGEKKKMKYETYTIDGSNDAAVKAAALNGLVEFKFYKEKQNNFYDKSRGFSSFNSTNNNSRVYGSTGNVGVGSSFTSNYFDDSTFTSSTGTLSASSGSVKSIGIFSKSAATKSWSPIVETGRIEKGPESEQEIKTVDAEFESQPFHSITYQLKPNSQKPTEIAEVRNYCPECGYRIRKETWKFCPKCGESL